MTYVYVIDRGSGAATGNHNTSATGATADLVAADTLAVGQTPRGLCMSPDGALALVANEGAGTVSLLATGATEQALALRFEARFDRWVPGAFDPDHSEALLELPAPYDPGRIKRVSVHLMGLLPCDTSGIADVADHDGNGVADLRVRFERWRLSSVLVQGDTVLVRAAGVADSSAAAPARGFAGTDTIEVRRPSMSSPAAGATVGGGSATTVRWSPVYANAAYAVLFATADGGRTWRIAADSLANSGSLSWTVPDEGADSIRLAIVQVERRDADGALCGAMALSGWFSATRVTGVEAQPVALTLRPVSPNPASGPVRLRFALPHATSVRLEVFDVQGRLVARVADGPRAAGWHSVTLEAGTRVRIAPGLYLVRMRAGREERCTRFVWLR